MLVFFRCPCLPPTTNPATRPDNLSTHPPLPVFAANSPPPSPPPLRNAHSRKKVLTETAPAANLARRQADVAEDFIVPQATLVRKQLGAGPSKVKPAWHGRADHGDHPPPHHHGKGPHHAPPGGGGHGKGPHHPGHFDQLGRASRLPEEERPTMFSVLADWIFGEETISEFSDVEEPWYRSPSKPVESLGPSWHLDDSSSSDDEGGEAAAVSHADIAVGDFFLYDDDYKAIMETREKPATLLLAGEEPPTPLHHKQLLHDEQPGSFRRKNLRGGEGPRPPCDKKPLRRPHPVEKADARPIDLPMKVRGVQITKRGGGGGGGSHFGGESSASSARVREQGPPPRGGQQPEHHRRHGGDHIRFRNRLPEDFDFEKSDHHLRWFEDSFDPDGDGPDLVEGILALFFFVGAFTLLLLPFFLLGRALKRLVRSARGCGGGGDEDEDAPDGYLALPDDAASVPAVSAAHDHHDDDDDSIVVTGTPVNPPPSVHI